MIRFSCPGCSATFNVSDDKAGKTGKCPKCSSQFTIPDAADGSAVTPAASAPPPVPTPATQAADSAVEIAPCPKCGARLSVEAGDIGLDVECPTCHAVYPAEPAAIIRPRKPAPGSKSSVSLSTGSGVKNRVAAVDDDEDDRPSRRSRRDEVDDEDDDRPKKKKKKKRRSDVESKRMTAGLLAIFLGVFGVHKFYLGYTGAGFISLFLHLCTCYMLGIIPLIEGIIYLTKSDEDFIDTYQIGQKEWF